ncbi:MAG: UbiA family prenyltransferase, partial [Deferribacteraceae bacterium]|nr:UbiA family prenyltransferase [Deferribacteraceae bacterium]
EKRNRPFSSGSLPLHLGCAFAAVLSVLGLLSALLVNPIFFICGLSYLVLTLLYSNFFKQLLLADIVVLTTLYTLRIAAGVAAINFSISLWIICFSFFTFVALSVIKRISELRRLDTRSKRRAYLPHDIRTLTPMAAGSICSAVLTLMLYAGDENSVVYYKEPALLLLLCPLLFFLFTRLLLLAERGKMNYDPVKFVLHDKLSYLLGGLGFLIYLAASAGVFKCL